MTRLTYASYIAELTANTSEPHEPMPGLFERLAGALSAFCDSSDPEPILWWYLLGLFETTSMCAAVAEPLWKVVPATCLPRRAWYALIACRKPARYSCPPRHVVCCAASSAWHRRDCPELPSVLRLAPRSAAFSMPTPTTSSASPPRAVAYSGSFVAIAKPGECNSSAFVLVKRTGEQHYDQ